MSRVHDRQPLPVLDQVPVDVRILDAMDAVSCVALQGHFLAEPGSAILRCIAALALSGSRRPARACALVESDADTTRSLPAISASKPSRATSAGSSLSEAPTFVSSMSARSKNSVSVG